MGIIPQALSPTPDDGVSRQLAAFEAQLRAEVGSVAAIARRAMADGRISTVSITPAVSWQETLDELVVQAGHRGGFFELGDRTQDGVDFIRSVVSAVVAGSVTETFAPGRSLVHIDFPDGTGVQEAGFGFPVPLPGWRRWGRTVRYEPYC